MPKFFNSILIVCFLSSAALGADPGSAGTWSAKPAHIDAQIRVVSTNKNGHEIEQVYLPDGEVIDVSAEVLNSDILQSGFPLAEVTEIREEAREVLELTLRGVLSDDFGGTIVLGEHGEAAELGPVKSSGKVLNFFKWLFSYNHEIYKPAPPNMKASAKLKRLVQLSWQFVFVETLHAGIDYYKKMGRVAPRFSEFGIAVDFKVEPQVFIGKFNPTQKVKVLSRSYAIFFEVSYSKDLHRVMVRSRLRREKGSGGLGLPALKAELKVFQSDGNKGVYKGKAWYPVSPPLVSFVLDSSEHYFAQGITVGLNSGDLVPGSTLTNTFTEFSQGENLIHFEEIPQQVADAFVNAANGVLPKAIPRVKMCSHLMGLL